LLIFDIFRLFFCKLFNFSNFLSSIRAYRNSTDQFHL
jgi:hypothetical protein